MPLASSSAAGEEDGGLRTGGGAGRATAVPGPKRARRACAKMQIRSASTGGEEDPTVRATVGGGCALSSAERTVTSRGTPSKGTKRKLEVIDAAPSPRRLTGASVRMEKDDGLKNAEAHSSPRRTRGSCTRRLKL